MIIFLDIQPFDLHIECFVVAEERKKKKKKAYMGDTIVKFRNT